MKAFLTRSRRDLLAVLAVAVVAAVPRLANILALDPFIDEISWVHRGIDLFSIYEPESWWAPLDLYGRPPLFAWLTALSGAAIGNGFVAGRVVAALAGAAAAMGLVALGRALFGLPIGVVAGLLWAASPFAVFFGRISSDDSLLSAWTIAVAVASTSLARQPSWWGAVVVGVAVGFAVLTKTLGLLALVIPFAALLLLEGRGARRTGALCLVIATAVALLVASPLLIWLPRVQRQLSLHADVPDLSNDLSPAPDEAGPLSDASIFVTNLELGRLWLADYVGLGVLALAAAGVLVAGVRRPRPAAFLLAIFAVPALLLCAVTTTPFSRYLLAPSFPLYVLAAVALVSVADLAARLARHAGVGVLAREVHLATLSLATLFALTESLSFTSLLVAMPARAPLPAYDRLQYLDQWYALYGLKDVVQFIRESSDGGRYTLLVPPLESDHRSLVPHHALRLYLRGDPQARFREVKDLAEARSLRVLRVSLCSETPRFLVVNGTSTPAPATPVDIPNYIRQLEARLSQDVPEARLVLRIPRPSGPNWLSVYRFDQPGGPPAECAEDD